MATCANAKMEEIRVCGKTLYVPSAEICGRTIVVTGKWIRIAEVKDEDVMEGVTIEDPGSFFYQAEGEQAESRCLYVCTKAT